MQIERMQLADLVPADYNPRTITDAAYKGLQASVARFGLVQPIILNSRTGNVVGGHQRLRVLIDAGETETDVVVVDLAPADEKALNLTLNNQAIAGEFTDGVLNILEELQVEVPDLCIDLRLGEIAGLDLAALRADFSVEPLDSVEKLDEYSGKEVSCPECGHAFRIGAA
jgi:hypothetical protein